MPYVGPSLPGTADAETSIFFLLWSDIDNIKVDDATYASASNASPGTTKYTNALIAKNFPFSIPGDATPDGVEVSYMCSGSNNSGSPSTTDFSVRLFVDGVIDGDNLSAGAAWSISSSTVHTIGGPTETFGLTLTAANINSGNNFGFSVMAALQSVAGAVLCRVEWMKMTVWFTDAGGTSGKQTCFINFQC